MKSHKLKILFFFILVFFFNKTQAQIYDSVLNVYEEQYPHEKIHIHFDRTLYNPGETLFFKLYLLTGLEWSNFSKNVYVDFYDDNGKFLKETVAPLFQSSSKGSFDIPQNYVGDFINVKAYTRWMLNDDSLIVYEKNVPINIGTAAKQKAIISQFTKVEIFPEGGELVKDLKSKVAFKATNASGAPVFIKGLLVNNKNTVIDTLKVLHDGFGNPKYAPCPLLTNMVMAGKLGAKSGEGFYVYTAGSKELVVSQSFK
jgi:hypothetical protein